MGLAFDQVAATDIDWLLASLVAAVTSTDRSLPPPSAAEASVST